VSCERPVSSVCGRPRDVSGPCPGEPVGSSARRAKKGGILEQDVDRLSGEPASLAVLIQRPGSSQRRVDRLE
jgi:hypothetical protein